MSGEVKDWHDLDNEECPQNHEDTIHLDCTCKRPVNRKPYRVCKVHDTLTDPKDRDAKTSQDIYIEVHPHGRLVFREKGKRTRFETTALRIYQGLRWKAALQAAAAARAARKNKKKGKRH